MQVKRGNLTLQNAFFPLKLFGIAFVSSSFDSLTSSHVLVE